MEKEKTFFGKISSYFSKEEEEKPVEKIEDESGGFWENIKNYGSLVYEKVAQNISETYETSASFITEKGNVICDTTAENFVIIKQKVGNIYEQIEIKNNLYELLSKIDLTALKENLTSLTIENSKGKVAVAAVVTFISIFEKHKLNVLVTENSKAISAEKQQISGEVSSFLSSIDFKETLKIAMPYILYIPHPAAPILYRILCFFV